MTATTEKAATPAEWANNDVIATHSRFWTMREDLTIWREDEQLACLKDAGEKLVYRDKDTCRFHSPVIQLCTAAGFTPRIKTFVGAAEPKEPRGRELPPRPKLHPGAGMDFDTPSNINWMFFFAPDEFEAHTGADLKATPTRMPVLIRDVNPDFRKTYTEDRYLTKEGEKCNLEKQDRTTPYLIYKKGDAVNPHDAEAWGDEVVEFKDKYPGTRNTVRSFDARTKMGSSPGARNVDTNIDYEEETSNE